MYQQIVKGFQPFCRRVKQGYSCVSGVLSSGRYLLYWWQLCSLWVSSVRSIIKIHVKQYTEYANLFCWPLLVIFFLHFLSNLKPLNHKSVLTTITEVNFGESFYENNNPNYLSMKNLMKNKKKTFLREGTDFVYAYIQSVSYSFCVYRNFLYSVNVYIVDG